MEDRMVKFYAKESSNIALHAVAGHFSTSHSHINYYIDVTTIKTRVNEAKEVGKLLAQKTYNHMDYIDTVVCMDGTELIGGFMADQYEQMHVESRNQHDTIYVVSPEINGNGQIIFRDNTKSMVQGKHVVLLLDTTTTGETIRRCIECIRYYGGKVGPVASIFSTIQEVEGHEVQSLFQADDLPNYQAYTQHDCPYCAKGIRLEAMVNGFGYSLL